MNFSPLLNGAVLRLRFLEVQFLNNLVQGFDQFELIQNSSIDFIFKPDFLIFNFLIVLDLNMNFLLLSSYGKPLGFYPLSLDNLVLNFLFSLPNNNAGVLGFIEVRAPVGLQSFFQKRKSIFLIPFLADGLIVLA